VETLSRLALRIFAAVFLSASALSAQVSGDVGKVLQVQGRVKDGDAQNLAKDDPIRIGQDIRTLRGSKIQMSFDGDGQLLLYERTRVVMQEPGPADDRHSECSQREVVARIKLLSGTLMLDHDPHKKDRRPRILEVETPDGFICLFGTSIQVQVDPHFGTGVFVWMTGAWVRHRDSKDWVKLEGREQTLVRLGEKLRVTRSKHGLTLPEWDSRFLDSPLLDLFLP